jgi:hypothetical protein
MWDVEKAKITGITAASIVSAGHLVHRNTVVRPSCGPPTVIILVTAQEK